MSLTVTLAMRASCPNCLTRSGSKRRSGALPETGSATLADTTIPLLVAVPIPSSRLARTRRPGRLSPPVLWHLTRRYAPRHMSAAPARDDGVGSTPKPRRDKDALYKTDGSAAFGMGLRPPGRGDPSPPSCPVWLLRARYSWHSSHWISPFRKRGILDIR